jgi:hypothetical protein
MTSSTFSLRDRLVMILERYVSPITVCSVLTSALAQRDASHREIDVSNLLDVVGEVMIGLRLFCDQDKLADLMFELADFCDRETQPFHPVPSSRGTEHAKAVPSTRGAEVAKAVPSTRGADIAKAVPSTRSPEVAKAAPSTRGSHLAKAVASTRPADLPRGDHELSYASSR